MDNYILEIKSITKTFPGVVALNKVSMKIRRGEVHALVGENGSGKSTLIKILFGIYKPDEGEVFLNGQEVQIRSTVDAINMGISVIFQEFNLISSLTVSENIFLGKLIKNKKGDINWKEVNKRAKDLLESLDFNIDPNTLVEDLSVAEKQMVEIAKALSVNSNIIFMDEPSATLTEKEIKKLFNIINKLKSKGVTVVYISHRLEEIFKICDRVTIIRDGNYIDTLNVISTTKGEIIQNMVGRSIDMEFPKRTYNSGEVLLKVENLNRKGQLKDISFTLNKGEILGIAGLVGAGRTELVRAVFGADKIDSGAIYINNTKVKIRSTKDAKLLGIALVPEDRKTQGLLLKFSVLFNTTLANLKGVLLNRFIISHKKEKKVVNEYVNKLKIKTPSPQQQVLYLSGGNQQKVVLSKWLFSNADILILDEPTRGIDVGAKYEIYLIMNELIQQGKSIIMISSELPEVIAMSDRILVMHEGEIKAELGRDEATPETIMQCAIG